MLVIVSDPQVPQWVVELQTTRYRKCEAVNERVVNAAFDNLSLVTHIYENVIARVKTLIANTDCLPINWQLEKTCLGISRYCQIDSNKKARQASVLILFTSSISKTIEANVLRVLSFIVKPSRNLSDFDDFGSFGVYSV